VIYSNIFLKDEHNQFTLNTNFWNAAAVNEEIPEFPTAIASVAVLAFATAIVVAVGRDKKKQRT
jgi:ABC-type multidrug transport system permease subunit